MKKIYTSAFLLLFAFLSYSQSAFVQVIHNSPIPGSGTGPVVDIYLNGNSDMANPDIPDFAFRTATPFVELPAGPTQIHVVVDGGDPATDTVFFADVTLNAERYTVIAAGIAGDADTPFGLSVFEGISEMAAAGTNDLLIYHGSPDAPAVIIDAKDVTNLESQLSFGQFGELRTVPNDNYVVDIRPGSDTTAIVGRVQAPLQALGLDGMTATVFASGFLGDTPGFGIFATLGDGTTVQLPDTTIASVQIIHNSPFEGMTGGPAVDIFVNGTAPGAGPLQGLEFRDATPFLELPGNVDFTFDVVPTGGTIDQSLFTLSAGILGNASLTVTAYGIAGNVDNPFALGVSGDARQFASDPKNVDVNAFHGAPDAPAVDIDAIGIGQIIDSLDYGRYTGGYLELPADEYYLGVRANNATSTVASFRADLSGLAGGAATVFASGYLANPNGSGFGLFAALPTGDVVELPMENVARVQIVHNAPVAETVDVWLGGVTKVLPDFAYRTATPFLTIPVDSSISITAPASTDTVGNLLTVPGGTLETGKTYYVAARGEDLASFGLSVYDEAREASATGEDVDVQAFHGSPDAPAVDVRARGAGVLFGNLAPGEFAANYVNVPGDAYVLDITLPGDEDPLFSFVADLAGLEGGAALVFASGFVTSEDPDSSFTLLAALPDGNVVELPVFVEESSFVQVIHNSPTPGTASGPVVDIYLNGNSDIANPDIPDFAFRTATPFVELPAGPTQIHIVLDGGNPATDTVLFAEATLEADERYTIIASGIAGDADTPFGLAINPGISAMADPGFNDLLIYHGSPDAPAVIIDAKGVTNLESQLAFGEFGEVRTVPNDDYIIDIRPGSDSTAIVGRVQAPLQSLGLDGMTATVFASGLLGDTPGFGIFATLGDGTTVQLPDTAIASVQIIHNSPFAVMAGGPAVDIFVNGTAPADGPLQGLEFREATPFLELPGNVDFTFDVVPAGGTIDQSLFTLPAGQLGNASLTVTAHGIAGNPDNPFNLGLAADARQFAADPNNVDVNAFHGAPDAPAVDIDAIGIGQIIDSLDFGRYTEGYLELPADEYYLGVRVNNTSNTVASFRADLSGLAGGAATVFASGYLANANGSPFGLFAALPSGDVVELPMENVARVQIVHNAPVAETVDVWLGGVTKAIPDFAYRTATPFLTIPVDSSISITAPGSTDTVGNFLTVPGGTLETGRTYYVAARGENLDNFGLSVYNEAREASATGEGIDLQAFHGAPDAPAVDVRVRNVGVLFGSLVPREFAPAYVNVPEDLYIIDITFPGEENPLFSFLADLNGLNGGAALAFASGFVTSDEPDSTFALLVALPDGTVVPLRRFRTGFANIIHASPAAAADSVDVYIGGSLALDNFPYLGATGYVELPVDEAISINVGSSTGPNDGQVLEIPANTLGEDDVHIVIVHGDGTDDFPITASFIDTARATNSQPDLVDVIAFHGIPGVGAVDVRNGGSLAFPTLIPNLAYGEFSDYVLFPETEFFLRFTPAGSFEGIATFNNEIFVDDESVVLLATGSVADGDYNLYVVTPDGSVFGSVPQSLVQIIHNSPLAAVETADIWLSVQGTDLGAIRDVPFRSATTAAYLPSRIPFDVGIAAGGSSSSADALASFPVTFEDGADYTVTAIGDVATQPVDLAVQTMSRYVARDGDFDLQVLHGSPDAPTVDILANGNPAVDNLEYGTYQGYLGLGNAPIEVSIADETGTTIVGTWNAPVDTWIADGNTAGTIFASGYLTPEDDEPGFGLYIAFADGTVEMLDVVSSVNELEKLLTGMVVMPNPLRANGTVQYSLEESMDVRMRIFSMDGRIVNEMDLGQQGAGQHTVNFNVLDLAPGAYQLQMLNERGSVTKRIVVMD